MHGKIRCGNFEDRDKQFNVIHAKLEKFKESLNPVLSMDIKKK